MNSIKLWLVCIVLLGLHTEVWVTTGAAMAAESTEDCLLLEDFESADWRSDWENNRPSIPSLRCKRAAHDGNYGLLNFGRWYYNPEVPLSGGTTRLGAWVLFPKQPLTSSGSSSASLGFGATPEGTLAFRLTPDEAQLVRLSDGYTGRTETVLATQPFSATPGEWYRIELTFPSLTEVHARVFDESAQLLLDTSIRDIEPFSAGMSFSATFARMDSLSVCNDGAHPSWRFPPLWQTISGDVQRTGQHAIDVQVNTPIEESWTFSLDQLDHPPASPCPPPYDQQPNIDMEVIYSSPAISGDGKVFFGSVMNCPVQSGFNAGEGWFYGLDQCTGELLWTQNMHGWVESSPALSHDNRVVYVGSKSGMLTAMDTSTGEKIWEFPTEAGITSSPAVDSKGIIYIGSLDGRLYAVHPDGRLKWYYDDVPPDGSIHATPALSLDERTVYFGHAPVCGGPDQDPCPDPNPDYALVAVDTRNGRFKWQFPIEGHVWGSPMVSPYDGSIVFPTFYLPGPNYVYSVSPAGTRNWRYPIDSFANGIPSIGPDGTVYVGEFARGSLYAINPDGTLKWQFTLAGNLNYQSSIALINGGDTLVFGTYGNQQQITGKVYALDADDMSVQWVYDAENVVQASVAVSPDGQIFFGDWNGVQHSIGKTESYLCE